MFLDQETTNPTPNVEEVGSPAVIDTTAIETNTTTTITTAVAETANQTETTAAPKPTNANRKKVKKQIYSIDVYTDN